MSVKDHYYNHLGNFYSWMLGDFNEGQLQQENFFREMGIFPHFTKIAFDLGAAHGLQTISLAKLNFSVTAVDFNLQLLNELVGRIENLPIEVVESDILEFLRSQKSSAEVIVCMGDTLTHLESIDDVDALVHLSAHKLIKHGRIILSFRDLTKEIKGTQRFIPVKSDENKILTCFLEYFPDHVMVYDILHERKDGLWIQKVSSYPKLRIDEFLILSMFNSNGIRLINSFVRNRMRYLIGEKI